jgi:hypothetical protein
MEISWGLTIYRGGRSHKGKLHGLIHFLYHESVIGRLRCESGNASLGAFNANIRRSPFRRQIKNAVRKKRLTVKPDKATNGNIVIDFENGEQFLKNF